MSFKFPTAPKPQEFEDVLEHDLHWVKRRKIGLLAIMARIEHVKENSLKKPEDFKAYEVPNLYALPTPFDFDAANREIERLDWIVGLLEKDIKKRDKAKAK